MDVIQAQTVLREHAKQQAIAEMQHRDGLIVEIQFYLPGSTGRLNVRMNADGTWEWA